MKKFIFVCLAFMLCFAMVSCGEQQSVSETDSASSDVSQVSHESNEEIASIADELALKSHAEGEIILRVDAAECTPDELIEIACDLYTDVGMDAALLADAHQNTQATSEEFEAATAYTEKTDYYEMSYSVKSDGTVQNLWILLRVDEPCLAEAIFHARQYDLVTNATANFISENNPV